MSQEYYIIFVDKNPVFFCLCAKNSRCSLPAWKSKNFCWPWFDTRPYRLCLSFLLILGRCGYRPLRIKSLPHVICFKATHSGITDKSTKYQNRRFNRRFAPPLKGVNTGFAPERGFWFIAMHYILSSRSRAAVYFCLLFLGTRERVCVLFETYLVCCIIVL